MKRLNDHYISEVFKVLQAVEKFLDNISTAFENITEYVTEK